MNSNKLRKFGLIVKKLARISLKSLFSLLISLETNDRKNTGKYRKIH